jgi:hypothetical protein
VLLVVIQLQQAVAQVVAVDQALPLNYQRIVFLLLFHP